jgi:hypothetical protein
MKIVFHSEFPSQFVKALEMIYTLQMPKTTEFVHTDSFESVTHQNAIVFMIDESKRGLDYLTQNQFKAGFKVFAFKINAIAHFDPFQLSVVTLQLWPKILQLISHETTPFIYTYTLNGKLTKQFK